MNWRATCPDVAVKGFRDGTHRLRAPAETVARVRPLMPAMGITRVANITGLDSIGIPVVMVCRPNARSLVVSQGKGLDLDAAKASGLMEAIETYHAETITLPLKLASYEELRYTHQVADVTRLPRPLSSGFHPYLPILWIEGYELMRQAPIWLPYELVHLNFALSVRGDAGNFMQSSNGLASGNHLLEAVSHGLCEVVERDAAALWCWLDEDERSRTLIDLASVSDRGCRRVLEQYARGGIAVSVWELTTDIEIPAFLCQIAPQHTDPLRRLFYNTGAGCHPTREIALLRALTEAAQSRLTMISGARDDCFRADYEHLRSSAAQPPSGQRAPEARRFADGPGWAGDSFEEDLAWELERLRAAGVDQVIVVDLTRPEFRIPVVRVVIPGLEVYTGSGDYLAGARARAYQKRRS